MILWQQYSSDPWKGSYDNHNGFKNYEIFKSKITKARFAQVGIFSTRKAKPTLSYQYNTLLKLKLHDEAQLGLL